MATKRDSSAKAKVSTKEADYRYILSELTEIFDDLSKSELRSLAKMNQIENKYERGQAIEYFWVAKNLEQ